MNNRSLMNDQQALAKFRNYIDLEHTDKKIRQLLADEFNYKWSISTIRRLRIQLTGVKKTAVAKKAVEISIDTRPPLSVPPPGIPKDEQALWFIENFKTSHLYGVLQKQLSVEEIVIYIEEYGRICCQFEDIVTSEFFQIDDFLKHRIFITRQIIAMRDIDQEIIGLNVWFQQNTIVEDSTRETRQEQVQKIQILSDKRTALEKTHSRYDKLCTERDRIENKLNATRKNRFEQIAGGKETFMNLVTSIQHLESEREKHGKYAELTRLAAEDNLHQFRSEVKFPDGEIDTVITDHESVNMEGS